MTDVPIRINRPELGRDPDWHDVRSRAAAHRRRAAVIAILVSASALAVLASAFAFAPDLWRLVAGTPIDKTTLNRADRIALGTMTSGHAVPAADGGRRPGSLDDIYSVRLIATREGRAHYIVRATRHERGRAIPLECFAVGPAGSTTRFGQVLCYPTVVFDGQQPPTDFPSPERPVVDMSVLHGDSQDPTGRVWRLEGFASDGITKVGILMGDGSVEAETPVVDNVYVRSSDSLPGNGPERAIVAYERGGKRIYVQCIAPGECKRP